MCSAVLRSFLAVLLVLAVAGCGDDNPADSHKEDQPGSLKGRVVDSGNPDQGLSGVTVRVEGTDLTAVTDEDGNFEFESVDHGDRAVVIDMPDDFGYQESRVEVSVHGGTAVEVDVTVLPDHFRPDRIRIEPSDARAGILEGISFYITIEHDGLEMDVGAGADMGGSPGHGSDPGDGHADDVGGWDDSDNDSVADPGPDFPIFYRPTWTIRSESPIGVISREGIFIGTATGKGQIVATLSDEFIAVADVQVVANNEAAHLFVFPPALRRVEEGSEHYLAALAVSGSGATMAADAIGWAIDPAGIGTIERADDLTETERESIVLALRPDYYGGPILGPVAPPIDHFSIARFRASAEIPLEGLSGEIQAFVGDYVKPVKVQVAPRGELTDVWIDQSETRFMVGRPQFLFAFGMNEQDQRMSGLEYTWRVEPTDLGVLEEWDSPGYEGDPWGILPPNWDDIDGAEKAGDDDPAEPAPTDNETGGPLPMDGPFLRVFIPERSGEGTVFVSVHDPGSGITIEASTKVVVEAPAPLSRVVIRPDRIDLLVGESIDLEASAFNTEGNIAIQTLIEWEIIGAIGMLDIVDRPHDAEYDSVLAGGGRPDPDDPTGPVPGGDHGLSWRIFNAGSEPGEGTVRASVLSADGVVFAAEAAVTINPVK